MEGRRRLSPLEVAAVNAVLVLVVFLVFMSVPPSGLASTVLTRSTMSRAARENLQRRISHEQDRAEPGETLRRVPLHRMAVC
jgi:hypothetical protein